MGGSSSKASVNSTETSVSLSQPQTQIPMQSPTIKQSESSTSPVNLEQPKKKSFSVFSRKGPSTTYTENYGVINMISFLCAIYCRLAYMDPRQFLGHYTEIFGPVIPDELLQMMNRQVKSKGIQGLLYDTEMFELTESEQVKFGLKTVKKEKNDIEYGNIGLQFLPWAQKVNQINGEERLSPTESNCDYNVKQVVENNNLIFATIATSNYSEIYVVRDKRCPNVINVIFRGTYSAKSAGSYIKTSSLTPIWIGNVKHLIDNLESESREKFIFGIYKILMDVIHVLINTIDYISKIQIPDCDGKIQILTTGHSLGGALSTIFAYMYVAHISSLPNFEEKYNLGTSICCISLGSPRVFGKELANAFCCLTENHKNFNQSNDPYCSRLNFKNIKGRIVYLRVTSYNDPVPGLPQKMTGYVHPCSSEGPETENGPSKKRRKDTNISCLVQITNSLSTRCVGKRLAMSFDYNLPLNCVDNKNDRKLIKGPILGKNPMGYHTQYLGISFIGSLSLTNAAFNEVKRQTGDTVARLVFYPEINGTSLSFGTLVFYNLANLRDKGYGIDYEKLEKESETVNENPVSKNAIELESQPQSQHQPQPQIELALTGGYIPFSLKSQQKKGQSTGTKHVPEDVFISKSLFEKLLKDNSEQYDIINIEPPLKPLSGIVKAINTEGYGIDVNYQDRPSRTRIGTSSMSSITTGSPPSSGGRKKRRKTRKNKNLRKNRSSIKYKKY